MNEMAHGRQPSLAPKEIGTGTSPGVGFPASAQRGKRLARHRDETRPALGVLVDPPKVRAGYAHPEQLAGGREEDRQDDRRVAGHRDGPEGPTDQNDRHGQDAQDQAHRPHDHQQHQRQVGEGADAVEHVAEFAAEGPAALSLDARQPPIRHLLAAEA